MPNEVKPNWVYLNGSVKIGEVPHFRLFKDLAEQLGIAPKHHNVANGWAAGLPMPMGHELDVARGHMTAKGNAYIWESNVDRNHVRDKVEEEHRGGWQTVSAIKGIDYRVPFLVDEAGATHFGKPSDNHHHNVMVTLGAGQYNDPSDPYMSGVTWDKTHPALKWQQGHVMYHDPDWNKGIDEGHEDWEHDRGPSVTVFGSNMGGGQNWKDLVELSGPQKRQALQRARNIMTQRFQQGLVLPSQHYGGDVHSVMDTRVPFLVDPQTGKSHFGNQDAYTHAHIFQQRPELAQRPLNDWAQFHVNFTPHGPSVQNMTEATYPEVLQPSDRQRAILRAHSILQQRGLN